MNTSRDTDQVVAAFFRAKAEIAMLPLVKDRQGDKAKYLQLSTLLAAIEPILLTNELAITQGCSDDLIADGVITGMRIQTILLHTSGQWIANSVIIPVAGAQKAKTEGGGFHPPSQQSGGVTITYGRRYGIFALFSLAVDEDTDGAARNSERRRRARETAESVHSKTADRLGELRAKLNGDRVVCLCGARQGGPHKPDCPVALDVALEGRVDA